MNSDMKSLDDASSNSSWGDGDEQRDAFDQSLFSKHDESHNLRKPSVMSGSSHGMLSDASGSTINNAGRRNNPTRDRH